MENGTVNSTLKPISKEMEIGTKGLRKTIIQKGVSWQTPIPGDEMEVHYNVSLQEGEYFDSSRERGATFKFKLGQCEVIQGWDEGISTMRKGERAIFTIPPELGYGESGSPPMIPPNSTLVFDVELISWCPVRDVSGDGGIVKKITMEGEGWATPNEDDEVLVNTCNGISYYEQVSLETGSLVKYIAKDDNGVVVSESSDEGLEFSLASGHLCPAMSTVVKTMRKGEKAEVSVKLSYGLKKCGNGTPTFEFDGINQHHQSLVINLELVSWKTVVDVKGDKKILKKITKKGEAFDRPNHGSLAKVIFIGKLEDGTVVESKGSEEEPFEYVCGEEQIDEDLDKAIMTMKKGEEAIVKIAPDVLTSASSILYEVKLIDFIKDKPFWKMDAQERIAVSESKKRDGNVFFKEGKFHLASKKYEKASSYIEYSHSFSDEERAKANSLRLSCYLNEAACKLKLGEYKEVSRLCTKVLEFDPYNVKALFRRSQAYVRTYDLEKAEEDLNRALVIDPNNKDLKIKQKELKDIRREYVKHEAKIYSTMISRIS